MNVFWLCWCGGMCFIEFILMGADKHYARRRKWRVPEKWFFLLALLGGTPGAILGMYVFHHKTRHWYFKWGLPAILLLQLWFLYWAKPYFLSLWQEIFLLSRNFKK